MSSDTASPSRPRAVAQGIGRHPRRAATGGVRGVQPSPAEQRALSAIGIDDPLMQGYMAWRRSLLFVAAPIAVFSGALAAWDLATNYSIERLNALGIVVSLIPSVAVLLLNVVTVIAALTWRDPRRSARTLMVGWAISLVAPLVASVLPVNWLVTDEFMNQFGPDTEFVVRMLISVEYAVVLLPTLLSFPSGVVRGAARIKSLLPSSTLAGWVLLILAPIYAVFFVVAVIIVEQLAGNVLLLLAIALLAASPFVHLAGARLYIRPLTTDDEVRRLDRVQRWSGLLTLVGIVLLVIWALTARLGDSRLIGSVADGALIDHKAALLRVIELVCRVLITTAVFSHVLLQVTDASWRFDRGFSDPEALRRHDAQMVEVDRALKATGERLG
ncbi:MAG: hypothetical protein ACRDZ2_02215 [Ilumatobacteraceae bacterium]